jgi:SAM-dependent methyltransferase
MRRRADRVPVKTTPVFRLDLPGAVQIVNVLETSMKCRICDCDNATFVCRVKYYDRFAADVFECQRCQCRFTESVGNTIAEKLHANPGSRYGTYRDLAAQAKTYYDVKDISSLRQLLMSVSKYKRVINSVERYPQSIRVLEVGCATGFLTAYFILTGYDIIGMDVSASALKSANRNFGSYFHQADSEVVVERAPYDLIYHTGTIGCVADPMALTRWLLGLLKPEGTLLFNAPNRDACWFRGQPWLDSAPPPDLTTIFKPGFWTGFFSDQAVVEEEVESCPAELAVWIAARKLLGGRWQGPVPRSLEEEFHCQQQNTRNFLEWSRKCARSLKKRTTNTLLKACPTSVIPKYATEFGLFVEMTKK